jgi:hypothetical protein
LASLSKRVPACQLEWVATRKGTPTRNLQTAILAVELLACLAVVLAAMPLIVA